MSFAQFKNKLQYAWHNLTYDPEAEEFGKQKAAEVAAAAKKVEKNKGWDKKLNEKMKEEKKEADEKAIEEAEQERRRTFSISGLLIKAVEIVFAILFAFLLFAGAIWGASLATNLNVYHSAPYRVMYAIWGFLFFWLVIPYTYIYRVWWLGRNAPRYYSILPLIPYRIDHDWTRSLLGWISYRPDDNMFCLEEWKPRPDMD